MDPYTASAQAEAAELARLRSFRDLGIGLTPRQTRRLRDLTARAERRALRHAKA